MDNCDVGKTVLNFYKELPFNYYGSIEGHVKSVIQQRPIEEQYPPLKGLVTPCTNLLEIGCGAGWVTNSIAYNYKKTILNNKNSVFLSKWPEYDPEKIKEDTAKIAIQINGKLRGSIEIDKGAGKADVLNASKDIENIKNNTCCEECFLEYGQARKSDWESGWRP